MKDSKEKRAILAQVFLMITLSILPALYFAQKYEVLQEDLYTSAMSALSDQLNKPLERQVIWQNSHDQAKSEMLYTAYYYPQALTIVCHTSPIFSQIRKHINAYLVSDTNVSYQASQLQDTRWNTGLLIFENIPVDQVSHLTYLDIVSLDQPQSENIDDPVNDTMERTRFLLA